MRGREAAGPYPPRASLSPFPRVAVLVLILLLVILGLLALLWAGTLVFQGLLYTEPAPQLYWRAPAAAGVLGLFLVLWCVVDANSPGDYDTLFNFSTTQETPFREFWAEKLYPNGKYGPKVHFTRRAGGFVSDQYIPFRRSDTEGIMGRVIIPLEDGEKVEFEPELTEKKTFKIEPGRDLQYHEVNGGRVISEGQLLQGVFSTSSAGLFWANVLLNLLHFGLWFGCLWLLLRFQWPHALGLAAAMWLVMTLTVVPMLLARTREEARAPRAQAPPPSAPLAA
jgi:hypothetical protein